jgi:hypothetical protein
VEIEDEDEGSIFYANSTTLAVQVSLLLLLQIIIFSCQDHISSGAATMMI